MLNFSKYFDIPIMSHSDIGFVDIPVNTDVKLFIDSNLIEAGSDDFSQICTPTIRSYFDTVFASCKNRDFSSLESLLIHCREDNETHLGNSKMYSQGRGASEEILLSIFAQLIRQGLFDRGAVSHPSDICVLAPNFDKDRMSDLLTNILREPLSRFTQEQCKKHGITLSGIRKGYCWDYFNKQWTFREWSAPMANGKPIMLVPKVFVCSNYHFKTSSYISRYLLEYRKRYHLDNCTDMCYERQFKDGTRKLMPPTKKDIKITELIPGRWKQHAMDFAYEYPDTMQAFDHERKTRFAEGYWFMSDQKLDEILVSV